MGSKLRGKLILDEPVSHTTSGRSAAGCKAEPVPPFLIVFNAPESFETYRLVVESKARLITLMSFPDDSFPCTIGVVFDEWNEFAGNICTQSGGYILSRAEKYLADISGVPLAEMLSNPQFTLNNPFDPKAVLRGAADKRRVVANDAAKDGGLVQTFDGEEFSPARYGNFDFIHHQYPKEVHGIRDNPDVDRIIDLACLNVVAQLFAEGEWKFVGAPDTVRMCAGVVNSSRYSGFADLSLRIRSPMIEIVEKYICAAAGSVHFGHILQLARGVAMSEENENIPLCLERWQQLLEAKQLGLIERVRQFELEMTTFQVRNGPVRFR